MSTATSEVVVTDDLEPRAFSSRIEELALREGALIEAPSGERPDQFFEGDQPVLNTPSRPLIP